MASASNLFITCSVFWVVSAVLTTLSPVAATTSDTITATQPLSLSQTIVSTGGVFELGFFSPTDTNNRWYVGIWYKNIPTRTYVWVANRDRPLTNPSGEFKIGDDGNIILVDEARNSLWSSNQTTSGDTIAKIFDSGNFVLCRKSDCDAGNYIWQSFDYPTDTLLPGMKLGWDRKSGLNREITSWKSSSDPHSGDYSFKLDINGFPEVYLRQKGQPKYRSGPWNGLRFSGVPEMKPGSVLEFYFVMEPDEVTYSFGVSNKSLYSRLIVNLSGFLERYTWLEEGGFWNKYWYAPKDQCDDYRECGAYGVCDSNWSPVCRCLDGFDPKNPPEWNLRDGSDGCVRKTNLNCKNDGFLPMRNVKLPETTTAFVDGGMSLADCEKACRRNCSCTAYASKNISGSGTGSGTGCVMWTSELQDMRQYAASEGGQDLFVKLSASDLEAAGSTGTQRTSNKSSQAIKIVIIAASAGILLLALITCFVWYGTRMQRLKKGNLDRRGSTERSQDFLLNEGIIVSKRDYPSESTTDELELPLFDFSTIAMATDNFCEENKLGQGGFGSVYKGLLVEGQEIAVKRLSKNSGQGVEEFKNEVRLIARLQHRNLVRLLGCCIEKEEKMLVYEYMVHKSLDTILFSNARCKLLDWQARFNIICGIARGLLYLHQDSRFRIIHRDLKASNILLDRELNPKISDFGMARIFGRDQTEANTRRVVGTYGYMSPEYAMDGLFSVKSDVFSFGVLALEIVSGKKNKGFYCANRELNLLGHAWRLWREEKGLELMDPSAGDSYPQSEVLRCIQVGLLCVQERPEDRPTMSSVVLMLSSECTSMAQPKNPGFCLGRQPIETDSSASKQEESCTMNQLTVTILDGR